MISDGNLNQMTEQAPKQNTEYDKRPLGRFLLAEAASANRERTWHREAYSYAHNFATQYQDQLRTSGSSFVSAAEIDEAGEVSIPTSTPSFDKAVWLEFEQSQATGYTWRLNSLRNEYYIDITDDSFAVTKYEMIPQGSLLRRNIVTDQDVIEGLHTLVKKIIAEARIDERVNERRDAMARDRELHDMLNSQTGLTLRQQKEKTSLLKSANERFFHSGSIGPRHKRTLY